MHGGGNDITATISATHSHQKSCFPSAAIRMLSPADVPPLRIAENTAKVSS